MTTLVGLAEHPEVDYPAELEKIIAMEEDKFSNLKIAAYFLDKFGHLGEPLEFTS